MEYRTLGRTGFVISEVSLGTWQVGGKWGAKFDHKLADSILNTAVENGVNFIDTADVYGDGESEKAVGRLINAHSDKIYVATKCGRQISPHINENYTPQVLRSYVEASLKNMDLEQIDLIQLHCPPTAVFSRPEIFAEFDKMIQEGKIAKLGVSVEKIEEALMAIEYDNVDTVQIIFNMFRQRPASEFFEQAKLKNIGIIARVPLASGLLSGKFDKDTTFQKDDHRAFNRDGAAFDKGETFSGVDYELGLEAVEELRGIFPNENLAQMAIRWILMFPEVSCVIPGASRPEQVVKNLETIGLPPLTEEQMSAVRSVYEEKIKPEVHQLW